MRAVDTIQIRDSENIVSVLDESREILRSSLNEFKREQNECRRQLETILNKKQVVLKKKNDNVLPLSMYLQQKRVTMASDTDLHSESTALSFENILLKSKTNSQQHPSDRAAVIKYLRKRERRKRAEENRKNITMTDDILEKVH